MKGTQDRLPQLAQATLAVRWLFFAALIGLQAFRPGLLWPEATLGFYAIIFAYTLAATLAASIWPAATERVARIALLLDLGIVAVAAYTSAYSQQMIGLGFLVVGTIGVLSGHVTGTIAAAALAGLQLPTIPGSTVGPDRWLAWAVLATSLLAAGNAGAMAARRLDQRADEQGALDEIKDLVAEEAPVPDTAQRVLRVILRYFRADSGSLMLFNPDTEQLEIICSQGLSEPFAQARVRRGEGIAGAVIQEGRPVLLTPQIGGPFRLTRREIGSSMCIPVVVTGQPAGVVNVNRLVSRPHFTAENLQTAELAAHGLAGLLLRGQFGRIVSAALDDLTGSQTGLSEAIVRGPSVLWPSLLETAQSLTGATFGVLALEREDTANVDIVAARGIDGVRARTLLPALLAASTFSETRAARGAGDTEVTCIPLQVGGQNVGALGLGLANGSATSHHLLEALGRHVAAAVHTARTAYRLVDIGVVEERRRIAREMHDGLAQTLADALLQTDLSAMAAQSGTAASNQVAGDLKELRGLLERAMRELREFMSELRRADQTPLGLVSELETLAKEFQRRSRVEATVVATGDDSRPPSAVRHALLAITRQALANVRTHAQASAVTIRLDVADSTCTLSVTDDGSGFDVTGYQARPRSPRSLGLTSMQERATLVGGTLQIESAPGRGTVVTARVQIGENDD
jgi:signal transduction histidine kinase/GAF domain-containing protein